MAEPGAVRVRPPRRLGVLIGLGMVAALAVGASLALRGGPPVGVPVPAAGVPDAQARLEASLGELVGWALGGAPLPRPASLAPWTAAVGRGDPWALGRLHEGDVPPALRLAIASDLPNTERAQAIVVRLLEPELTADPAAAVPVLRARGDGEIRYWRGCDCAFGSVPIRPQGEAWIVALGEAGLAWEPSGAAGPASGPGGPDPLVLGLRAQEGAPRALARKVAVPPEGLRLLATQESPELGVGRPSPRH